MDIVVVGKDSMSARQLAALVSQAINGVCIVSFSDALLALKHIYLHKTDMVFAESTMCHLRMRYFIEFIKMQKPGTYISIIYAETEIYADYKKAEEYVLQLGADSFIGQPLSSGKNIEIVEEIRRELNRLYFD